ncbi:porin family protein [uncultured Parasphingorhabdus sp.]|uniref:outer membrane protein n=1 Tax=uncultured Parasphingorhabdus sp. TaxID=2709694 RepID=UPI0030D96119|tara:strand:- start:53962 stop:54564 length:603 start_codon:yes stop_codon:yes gene_type:complete
MKKTLLAAACIAAFTATAPAAAQDERPFNGPWIGANIGYDSFTSGDDGDDTSEDGIAYGIALGYDINLGRVVLGIEGEIGDSSVRASVSDALEDGDVLKISSGRDIYAGIRLGVPVSDKMMVFAKGGYTNQRFKAAYTLDGETVLESDNSDGFRVGAGVELDFGQPFARLEYRYSDYGSFSEAEFETSRHQIMLATGVRF